MRPTGMRLFVGLVILVAGTAVLVSTAHASEGVCSFTLAGFVEGIWCSWGPYPAPCYLVIQVPTDSGDVEIGVWCLEYVGEVCRTLERDMPVVVLGDDTGEKKIVSHVAVWLEPDEASPTDPAPSKNEDR